MQVGDLVYDDFLEKYAIIIEIVDEEPALYKLLMDDGEGGYAYRSDIVLTKPVKK